MHASPVDIRGVEWERIRVTWATWSSPCHIRVQGLRVELLQRRMPEVRGLLIMFTSFECGLLESLVLGPAAVARSDRRLPPI